MDVQNVYLNIIQYIIQLIALAMKKLKITDIILIKLIINIQNVIFLVIIVKKKQQIVKNVIIMEDIIQLKINLIKFVIIIKQLKKDII